MSLLAQQTWIVVYFKFNKEQYSGAPTVFKKWNMRKKYSLHWLELICLIAAVFLTSYFLFQDDVLPISISSVWSSINHWARHFHVLAVALLPVYVALMVFGMATIGVFLGSALQRFLSSRF